MAEHTPTPWNAASKYSSVVGVPIVNQQGKRIGNTALPDMPPEWDHLKRQAEIDAAFIVKAVNNHDALVNALRNARNYIDGVIANSPDPRKRRNFGECLRIIEDALKPVGGNSFPHDNAAE